MPGAEATGLVIGAIALASLFSTCIELFDYFEVGKTYVDGHRLSCTKLGLLRERLHIWGRALNVTEPGKEDPALRQQWPTKKDIVGKSLLRLRDILYESEGLLEKHEVKIVSREGSKSTRLSNWSLRLRRRTVWAIHDKPKFDRLIEDISFLMDNMEKVTENVPRGSEQGRTVPREQHGVEKLGHRPELTKSKSNEGRKVTKASSHDKDDSRTQGEGSKSERDKEDNHTEAEASGSNQARARTRPGNFSPGETTHEFDHRFSGTQTVQQDSTAIQGVVGNPGGRWLFVGVEQTTLPLGQGIQGGVSAEDFAYLQAHAAARARGANPTPRNR